MMKEIKENPVKYIKSFATDIVVILVAFAYIFYQMVRFELTDLNPLVLIAGAIMGIICGIIIKQALGENGFNKGYSSVIWQEEKAKYNESCNTALEYIDLTDNYYLHAEKEKKLNYRRITLQGARLRYKDWFDEYGNYIGDETKFNELDRHQKRVLRKCIKIKVRVLNLFSEHSSNSAEAKEKEATDNEQRAKNFSKNSISAVVIAIIGVYFVPMLNGWSWASLISATMQVSLWVLFGILQLYSNFNFVVQDKVAVLRRKKELIAKFIKGAKEGLYDNPPLYEKPKEIEQVVENETLEQDKENLIEYNTNQIESGVAV